MRRMRGDSELSSADSASLVGALCIPAARCPGNRPPRAEHQPHLVSLRRRGSRGQEAAGCQLEDVEEWVYYDVIMPDTSSLEHAPIRGRSW